MFCEGNANGSKLNYRKKCNSLDNCLLKISAAFGKKKKPLNGPLFAKTAHVLALIAPRSMSSQDHMDSHFGQRRRKENFSIPQYPLSAQKDKELQATLGKYIFVFQNFPVDHYGTSSGDDEGNYVYNLTCREISWYTYCRYE